MPISDSNPERRNLTLASIAFILFFSAGGTLSDDNVRLVVVNATFTKPYVISVFCWALLLWFAIRFWQKNHLSFFSSMNEEVMHGDVPISIASTALESAKKQIEGANKEDHKNKPASVARVDIDTKGGVGVVVEYKNSTATVVHQEYVKIIGLKGLYYKFRLMLHYAVNGNAFSEELLPYLLFLGAVSSPFWGKLV